jgi:hypothetical protein
LFPEDVDSLQILIEPLDFYPLAHKRHPSLDLYPEKHASDLFAIVNRDYETRLMSARHEAPRDRRFGVSDEPVVSGEAPDSRHCIAMYQISGLETTKQSAIVSTPAPFRRSAFWISSQ